MKKVKITVLRITRYPDLMERYENPIEHPCGMEVGQVFLANGWQRPEGFSPSYLYSILPLKDVDEDRQDIVRVWLLVEVLFPVLHYSPPLSFSSSSTSRSVASCAVNALIM